MKSALKAAGVTYQIYNAGGDAQKQKAQHAMQLEEMRLNHKASLEQATLAAKTAVTARTTRPPRAT